MTTPEELLARSRAVAFSWHGVLFDSGRRSIHAAVRATFAQWEVELSDGELHGARGPTGRPQIERLLSNPRVAERFRAAHRRWPTPADLDAMARDLEPRLLEAARRAAEPEPAASEAIRRLHARGVRTAVIACIPRRLLEPQLEALARSGVPLDAVITADEACEPAPAPWGIFEAQRRTDVLDADRFTLIDDCPDGALAARNVGVHAIALSPDGAPQGGFDAVLSDLGQIR